jgi:hypothetical protein
MIPNKHKSATGRQIYWHGPHCYCDHVRLGEDVPCPVCDVWPKPEILTMPNGFHYLPATMPPESK